MDPAEWVTQHTELPIATEIMAIMPTVMKATKNTSTIDTDTRIFFIS